jgi:aspartate-semialdehyde dehydrogenase
VTSVAVVGATGAVGREMVAVLEERAFPVREIRLLASGRSAGRRIEALGATHEVRELKESSFDGVDLALFTAGSGISQAFAAHACRAGALVVDNSSAFRMDPACPLVVPEINGDAIADHSGILANPNCSTILLVMVLAPLHRAAGLRRVVVCSYQAVSGAGARAMEELTLQECAEAEGREPACDVFPTVIARNVIPWVQAFGPDGYSTEETKVRDETRRILGRTDLPVSATCVRVPVHRAHSEAVHVELEKELSPEEALDVFDAAPGMRVHREGFPTPRDVAGSDEVHVGRVREDRAFRPGLALWCVMDQLRKGAALNAVQIAERALARSASA